MKNYLLFTFLLFSAITVRATHIVGGSLSATQTGANTYTISAKIFRDCCSSCTAMPISITIGIYDLVTNNNVQTITLTNPVLSSVALGDTCFNPQSICIQEGIFTLTNVTIANNPNGYYLQTELYARNNAIDNIVSPGNTGTTFYTEIPDPALAGMNSTPQFGTYPSDGYFCVNNPNFFDLNAIEPDGDSLVYSLITPLASNFTSNGTTPGPYPSITWLNPYSLSDIVGGPTPMSIDNTNGLIFAHPIVSGLFAFCVKVDEYRSGNKISSTNNELQFYATVCDSCSFTSIENSSLSNIITYPNPFSDELKVNGLEIGDEIYIYNSLGQIVHHSLVLKNGTENIHLAILKNGIYFVQYTHKNRKISEIISKN